MLRSGALACALILACAGAVRAQTPNLSSLHDALRLTAQQEDAWRAYVRAVSPDPSMAERRRAAMQMTPSLDTPRRIDLATAVMEEELAGFRRHGAAVKAFYNQLTPEQRTVFDRQTLQLAPTEPPSR